MRLRARAHARTHTERWSSGTYKRDITASLVCEVGHPWPIISEYFPSSVSCDLFRIRAVVRAAAMSAPCRGGNFSYAIVKRGSIPIHTLHHLQLYTFHGRTNLYYKITGLSLKESFLSLCNRGAATAWDYGYTELRDQCELVASSTNSLGRWTCQQQTFCRHFHEKRLF
jgi:hypothetical protein